MMMRNILKKTRKIALLAKARGMMPRNVVAAPTMTEGPISPRASAIRRSFAMLGSWGLAAGGRWSGSAQGIVRAYVCSWSSHPPMLRFKIVLRVYLQLSEVMVING